MKNKKGFTLVELLAVIVILVVILIIAIPSIGNIIKKSKEDSMVSSLKLMEASAKVYISKEGIYTPAEGETEVIPLKELIKKGYIEKVVYPDGSKEVCDGAVAVTKIKGKYKYEAYLNCNHGEYVSENLAQIYTKLDKLVEKEAIKVLRKDPSLLPALNGTRTLNIVKDLHLEIKDPMDEENNLVTGGVVVNNGSKIILAYTDTIIASRISSKEKMAEGSSIGTNADINSKIYQVLANIEVKDELNNIIYAAGVIGGKEEEESINADKSGANEPKLANNMIPVKYNETTKKWVKADITNAPGDNQWYDYGYNKEDGTDSSRWANGVMVKSTVRNKYLTAAPGAEIVFTDILQFYVWIPRYKYRIEIANFHKTTPGLIDIIFEKGKETTGITTVNPTTGFAPGEYLTHPAFCVTNNDDNGDGKRSTYLGDDCADEDDWNLEGFWVGKFEISYNETYYKMIPTINKNGIENNNYSYATNFYTTAKALNNVNNKYGFVKPADDTHLIKSSEWGAVAYLSHSTYGRGNSAVWINNNIESLVGCCGGSTQAYYNNNYYDCSYNYDTAIGGNASTTGNIYGIYDMAGGSDEYTAATKQENNSFNAAIYADINTKYVDNMGPMPGSLTLDGTIGMALYETSSAASGNVSWYGDTVGYSQGYPSYTYPVFVRGNKAINYQYAGIFSYTVYEGFADYDITWRPSLVVK